MTMTYEAWRVSFQDAEQAARAAYEAAAKHAAERDALAAWAEEAHRELSACQSVTHQLAHHGEMCWDYSRDAKAVLNRKPEISLAQRDARVAAEALREAADYADRMANGYRAHIAAAELRRKADEIREGAAA
ncbi:hypothetical protein EVC62_02305 [Salinicola endophyticus]|uniref:Uncharacterized protein n=1 Tax=Salinicola endophyticus TaxID=1949083 RepID=A0ABY8FC88_9GAMM|nr:hypothetical protein [Salinicola endophyticus]WFF40424.1 hypothetical protein EVC62_02305 [Salinicola endophyticus]